MVRSKAGNTDNTRAAEPLVFSVAIWNDMRLGFKSCHCVTYGKKKKESEVRISVGSYKFFPISFSTSV